MALQGVFSFSDHSIERTMYTHLGVSSELDLNDINQAVIKDSVFTS